MDNKPLFSVLIANYNNGHFLQEAIDSVFSQTYTNWEIIIVDDGSNDSSFDLYEKYRNNSRFKIFYNNKNYGVGYTKKRCIELSNGEFCGFLDSDDALLPEALELMVNAFYENYDAALIFSRMYECDSKLNIISISRLLTIPEGESYFTNLNYGSEHFSAFRKCKYDLTEGISDKCLGSEDLDLYFKLEEVGKIIILDKITYKYRTKITSSLTHKKYYEDHLWGIIVKHNTCIRRGLDSNIYVLEYLKKFGEYLYNQGVDDGKKQILNTKAYKLGRKIIKPISFLTKKLR